MTDARTHLVVVGDALLDRDLHGDVTRVAPDAPVPVVADPTEVVRPGGAALAATLAAGDEGVDVTLVAAIGSDPAGAALRDALERAGVSVIALPSSAPTGEKIRVHGRGQVLVRVDRGGSATRPASWDDMAHAALSGADAILVSDYGRGMTADVRLRTALADAVSHHVPVVWDPHPRGSTPLPGVQVVTPNRSEALAGGAAADAGLAGVTAQADRLRREWQVPCVCVTLGAQGALLVSGDGTPLAVPAPLVDDHADVCGAGDRFAAAVAVALGRGSLPSAAIVEAVSAASRFVAGGAAGGLAPARAAAPVEPRESGRDAAAVVADVRARGGTLVATGGCFDLLHAGHVHTLQQARRLGDALVVCLNSDASVRRLKGPGRPVTSEEDRAAVLRGLGCVDAVVVFHEDTPEAVLRDLRPDVWAKGGDYVLADLPEAPLVASWGGQAVTLPYLDGRSTTSILTEVRRDR